MPNEVDPNPDQAVTEGAAAPSPGPTADRHKVRGARGRFVSRGGPRRRGGQPGNLNSPGAAIAPWRTLLRRGKVRQEFSWIVPQVERKAREYTAHMGGRDEVSDAEATLVERAALLHGAVLLVTAALAVAEDPSAVLGDLARLVRLERDLLVTLGLKRRAPAVDALTELRSWKATPQLPAPPAVLDVPAAAVAAPGEAKAKGVEQEAQAVEIARQPPQDEAEPAVSEATPAAAGPEVVVTTPTRHEPERKPAEKCAYCRGSGVVGRGTREAPRMPCFACQPKPEPVVPGGAAGDASAVIREQRARMGRVELAARPSEFVDEIAEEHARERQEAAVWGRHAVRP